MTAAPRKTVNVAFLVDQVNTRLAIPDNSLYLRAPGKDREMTPAEAFRTGAFSLLESVLHHCGQYAGFGYQENVVPDPDADQTAWGDETRRIYFMKRRQLAELKRNTVEETSS